MRLQDAEYLRKHQYPNASNLDTRISIHERFSTNPQGMYAWMLAHIRAELPEGGRLLELGCGSGRFWATLSQEIPATWQSVLTDLSPGMVQAARESSARAGLNLHFGLADAARIPFPPASFEAVCAHFMLYHVPDLPQALSEIRRVLRPGGVLFAATIGEGHMGELFELAGKFRPDWKIIAGRPAFHLENGAARLAPFFERVERRNYADGLLVDRAGPLADYVLSTTNFADVPVTEAQRGEIKAYLLARIETGGPLRITKNSGMFLARKGAA